MTGVYWILHRTGRWHAVWSDKDTGKSVCGRAKKKGHSWDKISPRVHAPSCKSCQARVRDRARR